MISAVLPFIISLAIELVIPVTYSNLIVGNIARFQKKFQMDILHSSLYKIYRLGKTL
jgi:hypothetical protein